MWLMEASGQGQHPSHLHQSPTAPARASPDSFRPQGTCRESLFQKTDVVMSREGCGDLGAVGREGLVETLRGTSRGRRLPPSSCCLWS